MGGILMLVLACALPDYDNYYPMFVLFTYVLVPIPTLLAKRASGGYSLSGGSEWHTDVARFFTAAFVVSGFGIPLVLFHHGTIALGAACLVCGGNAIIFLTTGALFYLSSDDYGL